jgi:hypothetical protein
MKDILEKLAIERNKTDETLELKEILYAEHTDKTSQISKEIDILTDRRRKFDLCMQFIASLLDDQS